VCSDSPPVNKQSSPKAQLASLFALLPRSVLSIPNVMERPGSKIHTIVEFIVGTVYRTQYETIAPLI